MLEVFPGSEHGGAGPDAPELLTPKDGGGVFRAMGRSSSSSDTQSDGEWEELAMGLVRREAKRLPVEVSVVILGLGDLYLLAKRPPVEFFSVFFCGLRCLCFVGRSEHR